MSRPESLKPLGLFVKPGFLAREQCRDLLREIRAASKRQATIYGASERIDGSLLDAKSVKLSQATRRRMRAAFNALRPEVERHFGLPLGPVERPRLFEYSKGGFLKPHRDRLEARVAPRHLRTRRVSLVAFVNGQSQRPEKGRFCGGSLVFYGLMDDPLWKACGVPVSPQEGTLIAFPVDVVHEVTPISYGRRRVLVSWFPGKGRSAKRR